MAENECLNLTQKLAKIRSMCEVVKKEKAGYNYKYADITSILAKITAGMKKYEVSLIPSVVPGTSNVNQVTIVNTKTDKTGRQYENKVSEMSVTADMMFKWVDDATQETIEVPWFLTGSQGDPSQAFGSGLTYCTRYFLCNYFQIAMPDTDVDAYRSKQKAAEMDESKMIAEEIINKFDIVVKKYLAQHPEMREDVKEFNSRYAKNGNYLLIKEPILASNIMSEFIKNYQIEEE